jgi:hypothetical protein
MSNCLICDKYFEYPSRLKDHLKNGCNCNLKPDIIKDNINNIINDKELSKNLILKLLESYKIPEQTTDKKECHICNKLIHKAGYARHLKTCKEKNNIKKIEFATKNLLVISDELKNKFSKDLTEKKYKSEFQYIHRFVNLAFRDDNNINIIFNTENNIYLIQKDNSKVYLSLEDMLKLISKSINKTMELIFTKNVILDHEDDDMIYKLWHMSRKSVDVGITKHLIIKDWNNKNNYDNKNKIINLLKSKSSNNQTRVKIFLKTM